MKIISKMVAINIEVSFPRLWISPLPPQRWLGNPVSTTANHEVKSLIVTYHESASLRAFKTYTALSWPGAIDPSIYVLASPFLTLVCALFAPVQIYNAQTIATNL